MRWILRRRWRYAAQRPRRRAPWRTLTHLLRCVDLRVESVTSLVTSRIFLTFLGASANLTRAPPRRRIRASVHLGGHLRSRMQVHGHLRRKIHRAATSRSQAMGCDSPDSRRQRSSRCSWTSSIVVRSIPCVGAGAGSPRCSASCVSAVSVIMLTDKD